MLKTILSLFVRERPDPAVEENSERELPQRWRDPPPKPVRPFRFQLRPN